LGLVQRERTKLISAAIAESAVSDWMPLPLRTFELPGLAASSYRL